MIIQAGKSENRLYSVVAGRVKPQIQQLKITVFPLILACTPYNCQSMEAVCMHYCQEGIPSPVGWRRPWQEMGQVPFGGPFILVFPVVFTQVFLNEAQAHTRSGVISCSHVLVLHCRLVCCHLYNTAVCVLCCRNAHKSDIFHRVQKWNGQYYQQGALWQVGIKIHTGHNGSPCPKSTAGLMQSFATGNAPNPVICLAKVAAHFRASQTKILEIISKVIDNPIGSMSSHERAVLTLLAEQSQLSVLELLQYLKSILLKKAEEDTEALCNPCTSKLVGQRGISGKPQDLRLCHWMSGTVNLPSFSRFSSDTSPFSSQAISSCNPIASVDSWSDDIFNGQQKPTFPDFLCLGISSYWLSWNPS
jgi:hypothetical protein